MGKRATAFGEWLKKYLPTLVNAFLAYKGRKKS